LEVGRDRNKRIQEAQDMIKTKLGKVEGQLSKDILNVKSKKVPKNLKIGESVEVLSLGQKGTVLSLPDDNGNVSIQVGVMKVNVQLNTLRRIESQNSEKSIRSSKTIMSSKSKTINTEIDLRGMNTEEAIVDIDKYLDDAYIAGLTEVHIIHGKGTGALREGVSSYLRKHRHVKSFRIGKYNEGGDGVTVVEVK
jgi:DNA mismatch repair protein MutS2